MKNSLLFTRLIAIGLIMLFSSGWAFGQVIISQYYEGASYDKWIEIANVGSSTINMEAPQLYLATFANPGDNPPTGTPNYKWVLSGTIEPGQILLFKHSSASLPSYAAGISTTVCSFNGNDIIIISESDGIDAWADRIDVIGNGTYWGKDKSFYRNSNISSSNTTFTVSEWTQVTNSVVDNALINTIEYLGTHLTTTWTGASNTNWATSGNWSNGIPTINHDVTIPTGKTPIIAASTSANCYDLTLAGTATLNIASTSATANGSLIIGGTYTGDVAVTYQRYFADSKEQMFGSPFSGQTINNDFLTNNSINGMIHYLEASDNWSANYYPTNTPGTNFVLGKGYMAKRDGSGVVNLTGTPNNAAVNISLARSSNGWNLLSNPFTSAIAANFDGDASNNLLTINSAVMASSYVALYIWDQGTTRYLIINNAGDGSLDQDYLQAGQGFFVKSIDPASATKFQMTPAMQSHQTTIAFKSSEETSWASIILNAEINDAKESTKILFREDMSSGLDIGYDAGVFKSNPDFSLYSRLVEDNGIDFGLQCLPSNYNELIIPIGLDAKAGEIVKFSINALNIPEEYAVILEDRTANTFTNLSDETAEYTIQLTNDSDGTGRFFIHTSFKSALEIDDLATVNAFQVFSRAKDHQLVIRGNANENATARIYSITGKQIAVVNLKQSAENIIPFNEEAGVYIVQITNEGGTQTQKFIWVK